jgi:hypothetical protein
VFAALLLWESDGFRELLCSVVWMRGGETLFLQEHFENRDTALRTTKSAKMRTWNSGLRSFSRGLSMGIVRIAAWGR